MRKIGVAIAVVFLSAYGPEVQALGVVVVLQMSLVAHLKYRPLCYAEQDALEGLGLTVNLLTVVAGIFFRATHVGNNGMDEHGGLYSAATVGVLALNAGVGAFVLSCTSIRLWKERTGVLRQPVAAGQDPDDVKALKTNHRADVIQRFVFKCRSFEDSALALKTVKHQLNHICLLIPEHAADLGGLLLRTERLDDKVSDALLRAQEVQRRQRNKIQRDSSPPKQVGVGQKTEAPPQ